MDGKWIEFSMIKRASAVFWIEIFEYKIIWILRQQVPLEDYASYTQDSIYTFAQSSKLFIILKDFIGDWAL